MSTSSIVIFASWGVVFGLAFFLLGFFVRKRIAERMIRGAEQKAAELRAGAEQEAEERRLESAREAETNFARLKKEFDEKHDQKRRELEGQKLEVDRRAQDLEEKVNLIGKREREIDGLVKGLHAQRGEVEHSRANLERLLAQEREILQRISGLSADEAKRQLLKRMEVEVRSEASLLIKSVEEEAREIADRKAKNILSLAIQRCAAEHSIESTVSVINLPSEEMKGRIIGKEGRNIRTFETATGVDLVIDDTPGAVILSAFDTVRREIARIALEKLIEDGRIHPSSIEEVVGRVRQEMDRKIKEDGENAIFELGVGDMHPELIYLLGRLKYRTSYGQNSLSHSKEVAYLMNIIAGEVGIDPVLAKRVGLLHDIGKAVSHEMEGPHALIGGELARRYGEPPDVVHGIEAHHGDIEQRSVFPILIQAADAVSGARPGARRESLENYIKRLEKLEKTAGTIPGVERVFAIQAGREVRVMVHPDEVGDNQMPALAREISKKVKEDFQFPGQIRVTVIRETRATEFVK